MTWIERTAYPRLPRTVSALEFEEAFRPTDEEVEWRGGIPSRTRTCWD